MNKALELIEELKHLAGEHDQRTHAPKSGSYTPIDKWSVEFTDFAGFEKYLDESSDKMVGGLYNIPSRKFYATEDAHQEIANALYPNSEQDRSKFLDSSVRFIGTKDTDGNLSLTFDVAFAAAGQRNYDKGLENIYKAFDVLKLHGFPPDTDTTIRIRGQGVPRDMRTTLKHLPGEHNQATHGRSYKLASSDPTHKRHMIDQKASFKDFKSKVKDELGLDVKLDIGVSKGLLYNNEAAVYIMDDLPKEDVKRVMDAAKDFYGEAFDRDANLLWRAGKGREAFVVKGYVDNPEYEE